MGFNIYYIGCITKKPRWDVNSINSLYLMINRIDGFIEEKDGDKYLSIAFTDRNSEVLRKYSEVWSGMKDCIAKINGSDLGEYDTDFMKIKFNSDNDIPLNKQLYFLTKQLLLEIFLKKMVNIILIFLDECLYEV